MKKVLFFILLTGFLVACGGGDAPQTDTPSTELNQQIDAIGKEITEEVNKEVESLEKEGAELEKDLDELDNL